MRVPALRAARHSPTGARTRRFSAMRSLLLFPLLLAAACTAPARPAGPAADEAVQQFYTTYIAAGVSGAPSEAQLAQLAPYLSDSLQALLKAAAARRDADQAAHPDEKPRFVEGDLFSSLFEGPASVTVQPGDTTTTPRTYIAWLSAQADTTPIGWSDTVRVVRQGDRWVIADIAYGGTWDFAQRGSLVASLTAGLAP